MQAALLALDGVEAANSRYRFPGRPPVPVDLTLLASIKTIGLIEPIVVHKVASGRPHVVAGFARYAALRELGKTEIECRFLPVDIDPGDIMRFICQAHRHLIMESVVNRIRFLQLARALDVPLDTMRDHLLPLAGFEAHDRVLRRCWAVADLPASVLWFCHEKNFSMKQCVHLTRHPRELLELLFEWRDGLALTASVVAEVSEHIKDYLRASGLSVAEFAGLSSVRAIVTSDQSPQERTRDLRRVVREMRFPILTETHTAMHAIKESMNLPRELELRWDPALEQRAVELRIRVRDENVWPKLLEKLGSTQTRQGLHGLLERL